MYDRLREKSMHFHELSVENFVDKKETAKLKYYKSPYKKFHSDIFQHLFLSTRHLSKVFNENVAICLFYNLFIISISVTEYNNEEEKNINEDEYFLSQKMSRSEEKRKMSSPQTRAEKTALLDIIRLENSKKINDLVDSGETIGNSLGVKQFLTLKRKSTRNTSDHDPEDHIKPKKIRKYVIPHKKSNLSDKNKEDFIQNTISMILQISKDKSQRNLFFSNTANLLAVFSIFKSICSWRKPELIQKGCTFLEIGFFQSNAFYNICDNFLLIDDKVLETPIKLICIVFDSKSPIKALKTIQTIQGAFSLTSFVASKAGNLTRSVFQRSSENENKFCETLKSRQWGGPSSEVIDFAALQAHYEVFCAVYELKENS